MKIVFSRLSDIISNTWFSTNRIQKNDILCRYDYSSRDASCVSNDLLFYFIFYLLFLNCVAIVSENAATFLQPLLPGSTVPKKMLRHRYSKVFSDPALEKFITYVVDFIHQNTKKIHNRDNLSNNFMTAQLTTIAVPNEEANCYDITSHRSGHFLVLEFLLIPKSETVTLKLLQSVLTTIDEFKDFQSSCEAVNKMKAISGFDRVLLYKFDEEYNGMSYPKPTSLNTITS